MTPEQYALRAGDLRRQAAQAVTDCEALAEAYRRRRTELDGLRRQLRALKLERAQEDGSYVGRDDD
jgi:hypothetical protein